MVPRAMRSEEHTSELQSRGLISYAVFCLKKKERSPEAARDVGTSWSDHNPLQPDAGRRCLQRRHAHGASRDLFTIRFYLCSFFFNDSAPPEFSPLSLHDALPI